MKKGPPYAKQLRERTEVPFAEVLVYAGAAVTNMFFYFAQTFMGPHPPQDLLVYLPANLPWLIAPVILALRVRSNSFITV